MSGTILMLALGLLPGMGRQNVQQAAPAHVVNSFEFEVHAPFNVVAPLFGPEGERCWAGKNWNPMFVWPQPAKDVTGAVFTVQHGPHTVVWVNTIFDVAAGRMQYVAVIPSALTFTVDVRLTAVSASLTKVNVTYTRTALDAAMNDEVVAMGASDRENGPYWQRSIEDHLKSANDSGCGTGSK